MILYDIVERSDKRNSEKINIFNTTVTYKYTSRMSLIKKQYSEFINSILEKKSKYMIGELELHVSPFLEYKDKYIYQPVFDFDKGVTKNEILKFIRYELKSYIHEYLINIELSVNGYHVVCYTSYGLLTKENIDNMRKVCMERYKSLYPNLDIISSMRLMPIRRTPSVVNFNDTGNKLRIYPLSLKEFIKHSESDLKRIQKSKLILSDKEINNIIKTRILPNNVVDITESNKVPYFIKDTIT